MVRPKRKRKQKPVEDPEAKFRLAVEHFASSVEKLQACVESMNEDPPEELKEACERVDNAVTQLQEELLDA